jgi:uncharacterized membrane protein
VIPLPLALGVMLLGVLLLGLGVWLEAQDQDRTTGERRGRTRTRE